MEVSVNDGEYKVTRGLVSTEKEVGTHDYSSVYYTTQLSVNRPIRLTGLSFFGQSETDNKKFEFYTVRYEIRYFKKPEYYDCFPFFPKKNVPSLIIDKGVKEVKSEAEKLFRINLDVPIPENTMIEIAFSLKGPSTRRMKKFSNKFTVETKPGIVRFMLSRGTQQMPEIFFRLEEEMNSKSLVAIKA